jgi:hypothetical protein
MFSAIKSWRRRRILARNALPNELWNDALSRLEFLRRYPPGDRQRLRDLVVLFLDAKFIVGAGGFEVTPLARVVIALQACILILNLDLDYYTGWESVVVYAGEFVTDFEWVDDAGVVHRVHEPIAGEAMPHGPVMLSWEDVEASADWDETGMNLVIHEFAHKLDMLDGDADGTPPLHANMSRTEWQHVFDAAYEDFCARVDAGETPAIDEYAAEAPGEFFAVGSEVFFAEPELLWAEYPELYRQLALFYRQDPLA